jgi:SAM-dependent methyltransferase
MSAFVPDVPDRISDAAVPDRISDAAPSAASAGLTLTGERTIPDLDIENYWFRRHEVVYQRLAPQCAGRAVLEAGCGEGYGANLIADVAARVIAVDYDETAVAHVRGRYPRVQVTRANLADLPLPDASVDVVVNFQVIEHLWDQGQFVRECRRVLRPSGLLMVSTPNRITFSPGRDTPINPFHTRELNADELTELLLDAGFSDVAMYGLFHGPRLREMDARHGGSIIDAQIKQALAGDEGVPWSPELIADVAAVTTADFEMVEAGSGRDIADSLDLIVIAVRP